MTGGGHSQANLDELSNRGIAYSIEKTSRLRSSRLIPRASSAATPLWIQWQFTVSPAGRIDENKYPSADNGYYPENYRSGRKH